jgi:hypothetical protein
MLAPKYQQPESLEWKERATTEVGRLVTTISRNTKLGLALVKLARPRG